MEQSGFSQSMLIKVAEGFEPTISMVSPINESYDYADNLPSMSLHLALQLLLPTKLRIMMVWYLV